MAPNLSKQGHKSKQVVQLQCACGDNMVTVHVPCMMYMCYSKHT